MTELQAVRVASRGESGTRSATPSESGGRSRARNRGTGVPAVIYRAGRSCSYLATPRSPVQAPSLARYCRAVCFSLRSTAGRPSLARKRRGRRGRDWKRRLRHRPRSREPASEVHLPCLVPVCPFRSSSSALAEGLLPRRVHCPVRSRGAAVSGTIAAPSTSQSRFMPMSAQVKWVEIENFWRLSGARRAVVYRFQPGPGHQGRLQVKGAPAA